MTYEVRDLEEKDRAWVVHKLGKYTIENDLKRPELYCPEQLSLLFTMCLERGKTWVVEINGKPAGVLGGLNHGHVLNPAVECYTVVFWFVDPGSRKSMAAWRLLREAKRYSEMTGRELAVALQTYSLKDSSVMKRLGFREGEQTYRFGDYYGT